MTFDTIAYKMVMNAFHSQIIVCLLLKFKCVSSNINQSIFPSFQNLSVCFSCCDIISNFNSFVLVPSLLTPCDVITKYNRNEVQVEV